MLRKACPWTYRLVSNWYFGDEFPVIIRVQQLPIDVEIYFQVAVTGLNPGETQIENPLSLNVMSFVSILLCKPKLAFPIDQIP